MGSLLLTEFNIDSINLCISLSDTFPVSYTHLTLPTKLEV